MPTARRHATNEPITKSDRRVSATSKKKRRDAKTSSARETRQAGRARHSLWENVKGILGAVAIFLFLRTFIIEAYRIPSGSMIPALLIGDWLFVNKLVYGPHVPFTRYNLPGYAEPKRYEIAVFVSPPQVDQPDDPTPTLVKRIIGMPGDTIYMRQGVVFVNGAPLGETYGARSEPGDPDEFNPLFLWQKRIEVRNSRFGPPPDRPTHDNWGPLLVPERHYFMLGDNRYQSKDSRYWGVVPRENIRGRPMFVYYSYDPESGKPLPFITAIRWGRLFHRIR